MKITTILFDLDGTLLPMDIDLFSKKYYLALTKRFAVGVDPDTFTQGLAQSIMQIVQNDDPKRTNQEIFMEDFFQRVPLNRDEVVPQFADFYLRDFPKLKDQIELELKDWPARVLMDEVFSKGYQVVIATNPLFPMLAIKERLRWVGLLDYPYKLVTAYEEMHFCKPNPNYFLEICQKIGVQPKECLMIGNDMEEDLPAATIGMKTFIVQDFLIDRGSNRFFPDGRGSFAELYRAVKEGTLPLLNC